MAGFRKQFKFWLDLDNNQDLALAEAIEGLKKQRIFARTIRDGLRLIIDLRQGNTSVLFELFPHLGSGMVHTGNGHKPIVKRFAPMPVVETQTVEAYLDDAFEDLDALGF